MMNKKILVTRIFPEAGLKLLKEKDFKITTWDKEEPMPREVLLKKAKEHDALMCTVTEKIDHEFLHTCKNLEIISQVAVGYDNIDVEEATRLGIPIAFTPDVLSGATADIAFLLMLAASRKMIHLHNTIIKGEWSYFKPTYGLGIELNNKTLGIFGLGRIGLEMAKRCMGAYNMNVIYHNRKPNPVAEKILNAKYVSFEELLEKSDVLSVHCSLTPETTGIFDKKAFNKMKSNAIFVNTSRGLVHNEKDLIQAIHSKKIWGAGLDVTNPEPMKPDNPLLSMENVVVLPHIGSATIETRDKMSIMAAENIIDYYKTGRISNIVNPQVFE